MREMLRRRRFYPSMPVFLCFFAGIGAGTIWINRMAPEIQGQLGAYGQAWFGSAGNSSFEAGQLLHVLIQRELAAGFLWLLGMTAFSIPGLSVLSLFGGFSLASILSLMTIQAGLMGLPIYILSLLPQALFYGPAVLILYLWGLEPDKKTHLAGYLILAFIIALGAVAECCINPVCMGLFKF